MSKINKFKCDICKQERSMTEDHGPAEIILDEIGPYKQKQVYKAEDICMFCWDKLEGLLDEFFGEVETVICK